MFTVDIMRCGVVRATGSPPYPIFVVTTKHSPESCMCYKRYSHFLNLEQHVIAMVPGLNDIPKCPVLSEYALVQEGDAQLDRARIQLQDWLNRILLYDGVKESQVFRDFLCSNSTIHHPEADVSWVQSSHFSLEEMEMDDMFNHHQQPQLGQADCDNESDLDISNKCGGNDSGYDSDCKQGGLFKFSNSGFDLPTTADIASSVPVEISFLDSLGRQDSRDMVYLMTDEANATHTASQAVHTRKNKIGLDNFKFIRVIGKGSFGKVFVVRDLSTGKAYAMKVLRKDNIIKRNQVEHTKTERNVLGYIRHPFIVGLTMAFQTEEKLFFALDYCAGGELFFHLGKVGKFPEPRARFYIAEIALALNYIHELDIVYRDLKPENVLLDGQGHIRLTDFGLSKEGISNTTSGANSFCGTPEYLAPEILNRSGHGRAVDWWSLGALLYEMLTGLPPFYSSDREKLFHKIRHARLEFPLYLNTYTQDILRGLLTRDPAKRLGSGPGDASDVKSHIFFKDIDFEKLLRREVMPPWQPNVVGSLDTSQFDHEFTSMSIFSPSDTPWMPGGDARLTAYAGDCPGSDQGRNFFEGFTYEDRNPYLI